MSFLLWLFPNRAVQKQEREEKERVERRERINRDWERAGEKARQGADRFAREKCRELREVAVEKQSAARFGTIASTTTIQPQPPSGNFFTSMFVAEVTDSAIIGAAVGGDWTGAVVGQAIADSSPSTPEAPCCSVDTTPDCKPCDTSSSTSDYSSNDTSGGFDSGSGGGDSGSW